MNKKVFIIIFLIIIFSVFIFVPFKEVLIHFKLVDFYKTDNWKIVEKSNNKIYDKIMSLESNIENRYNNYFPFYNKINSMYYNSIINIDGLYLNDIYLKDNSDFEHLFYEKENNLYYLTNHYSNNELEERLNNLVYFYNDIKNKYPNVDLMVYLPLRYSETKSKNVLNINEKINDFTSKLDKNIKYSVFDTDNYLKYFYRTDHHYNSYGAELVYLDILNKFNLNNNLNISHKTVYKNYYGSMAKSILSTKIVDNLSSMNISNNLKVNINDTKFKPLKIEERNNTFHDYYVQYFDGQYDEIIYENNNNFNRNLLIISDSLIWQIDYLLANNFDKTYVVNMKYGKWKDNNLYLDNYIKNNNITHILFLREAKNIIFDADNFKLDKRVVR